MPSYTTIVNTILRSYPAERSKELLRAVQKLHPQAEPLSSPQLTQLLLSDQLSAWLTRHTWEACRSWKWPHWLTVQTNPASSAYVNPALSPLLLNQSLREAAPIPGLPGQFSGTVDRRGMITPPHGRYSIETWIRFRDHLIIPSQLLDNSDVRVSYSPTAIEVELPTPYGTLELNISAHGNEVFKFIHLRASCCNKVAPDAVCPATIYVAIRPYNLESVFPTHDLVYNSKGFWMSDNNIIAWLASRPDTSWASDAHHGDAAFFLADPPERTAVRCPAGLATAVSGWHLALQSDGKHSVEIAIPLTPTPARSFPFVELMEFARASASPRKHFISSGPERSISFTTGTLTDQLFNDSGTQLPTLVDISNPLLQSQFLRRSHWIVSAVRALLYNNNSQAAARLLQLPALDIKKNGELPIAAGKWSLHGQFLTAAADYHRLTQAPASSPVVSYSQLRQVARWLMRKRREVAHAPDKPQGLLPPGSTRSNIGVEYQLTDNLWALQGILAAAWLARFFSEHRDAEVLQKEAARYATNISAAIHRELEYSMSQQVPGRLHRVFDSATAAEILDIALMPDVMRMLRADDWLTRLVDHLAEPTFTPPGARYQLRRIDENGVYPARRMLLCLAALATSHSSFTNLFNEVEQMQTTVHSWTECINPHTGMGVGTDIIDPEATAMYTVLVRSMLIQETDNALKLTPLWIVPHSKEEYTINFQRALTIHGPLTASVHRGPFETILNVSEITADPVVEISWAQENIVYPLGADNSSRGTHTHKLTGAINNSGF